MESVPLSQAEKRKYVAVEIPFSKETDQIRKNSTAK